MSGSNNNHWNSYLNGKTTSYNFSYNTEKEIIPLPAPHNSSSVQTHSSMPLSTLQLPKNTTLKKNQNLKMNYKIGGKRKTKHSSKKYRYSKRK